MNDSHHKDQIENIIEHFDFVKVRTVMQALDWCWYYDEWMPARVPYIEELQSAARQLLNSAISGILKGRTSYFSHSGGLEAYANLSGGKLTLELKFVVEWVKR